MSSKTKRAVDAVPRPARPIASQTCSTWASDAQQRIRRFAIEERLEHGLPPVELLDLYRALRAGGDLRAQQYLDRVFVDREPPSDWLDLQSEAGRIMDLAEARGRDAGRLFADLFRTSPGIEPLTALRLLLERLSTSNNVSLVVTCAGSGALRPPPPVHCSARSSLRAHFRGDPPRRAGRHATARAGKTRCGRRVIRDADFSDPDYVLLTDVRSAGSRTCGPGAGPRAGARRP